MNWFKKQGDRLKGTGDRWKVAGDRDTATQPLSPITYQLSPNSPLSFFYRAARVGAVALVLFAASLWPGARAALASTSHSGVDGLVMAIFALTLLA